MLGSWLAACEYVPGSQAQVTASTSRWQKLSVTKRRNEKRPPLKLRASYAAIETIKITASPQHGFIVNYSLR